MDRNRLAIFASLGLFVAGIWYWRRAEGVAAPALDFGTVAGAFAPFTEGLQDLGERAGAQASETAEDFLSAIAPGPWTPPARAAPYLAAIAQAEDKYSIPPQLLARLLYQESRYRPEIIDGSVRSSAGAIGIAQFMPATAAEMGVDPLNTDSSIDGAARYLRRLYDGTGTWAGALAAYNWGIGNVRRRGLDAAPAETREYVSAILGDVGLA